MARSWSVGSWIVWLPLVMVACDRTPFGDAGASESKSKSKGTSKASKGEDDDDDDTPKVCTVRLHGAVIGPARHGGLAWDSNQSVAKHVIAGLGDFLADKLPMNKAAAGAKLASLLATYESVTAALPDAEGWAEVEDDKGARPRITLAQRKDTFTPNWDGVDWTGIRLTSGARLRVHLFDNDKGWIKNHPPEDMGVAVVGAKVLKQASLRQDTALAPVWQQTSNQVLALQIEVTCK